MAWPTIAVGTKLTAAVFNSIKDYIDNLSGTSAATASALMRRDAAGRAQVADPSAAQDIATKNYTDKPLFFATQTVSQSIANNSWASITFTTEALDTHNGHDNATNPSRYTAQRAGWHKVAGKAVFTGNATGARFARLLQNGVTVLPGSGNIVAPQSDASAVNVSAFVLLAIGDYVELQGFQGSGGALASFVGAPEYQSTLLVEMVR